MKGDTDQTRVPERGLVVRTESGFHRVQVDDEIIVSQAPKRLLGGQRRTTTAVVIGDWVTVERTRQRAGIITDIEPRRNELVRGAAGGSRLLDVIAANIDLLVAVHSLVRPDLNLPRLDRFLLIAEAAEVASAICLTKVDLSTPDEVTRAKQNYANTGYPLVVTSVSTQEGLSELRNLLEGKVTALVGPSGAGKSSLLNALQPGLRLRTGNVNETTGKGRHTTTTAELLPLLGGFVADTPGLRELALREVEAEDLAWLYPEFRSFMTQCRFTNCSHRGEEGCAIRSAAEKGAVPEARYESYLRVYEHLKENAPEW